MLKATEDLNNSTYWSVPGSPTYVNPLPEGEVVGYNGSKEGVFTLDKASGNNNYVMADLSNNAVTTTATEVWTYSVYAKSADGSSELLIGIWNRNVNNEDPWTQTAHAHFTFNLSGPSQGGMRVAATQTPSLTPGTTKKRLGMTDGTGAL